ncbi:unnamed protein product [Orchesella dallaii]|uniref:Uncharacterized protein n=1 Tax=Orchesella dallaii TaxID=48710 RepID=A0ABP1RI08_9HEXA
MDHRLRPALSTPSPTSQSKLTPPNPDNHHYFPLTSSQLNQQFSAGSNSSNYATISPQTSPYLTLEQQIIPF